MDSIDITLESKLLAVRCLNNLAKRIESANPRLRNAPGNRRFRQWMEGRVGGKQVALFLDPTLPDIGHGLLSLHLSQFSGLSEVCSLFEALFEHQWPEAMSSRIRRLDLCVDLLVPSTDFFDTVLVPRAKVVQIYRDSGLAIYFGRGDRVLRGYPKERLPTEFDFVPEGITALAHGELATGTRLEVQLRRKRVPIPSLDRIEDLRVLEPFKHVKLVGTEPSPAWFPSGTLSDRVGHYLHRRKQVGASLARREFNRNGHFERDIGSKLRPTHQLDLQALFLRRLDRFIDVPLQLPKALEAAKSTEVQFFENLSEHSPDFEGFYAIQ